MAICRESDSALCGKYDLRQVAQSERYLPGSCLRGGRISGNVCREHKGKGVPGGGKGGVGTKNGAVSFRFNAHGCCEEAAVLAGDCP